MKTSSIKRIGSIAVICLFAETLSLTGSDETITGSLITVSTNKVKENIINNDYKIDQDMSDKLRLLNYSIDREVDNLFSGIENNIDRYLDYHYSVVGEYEELYASMAGDIVKDIEERLLGTDFDRKYEKSMEFLNREYKQTLKQHFITIDRLASENIDMELNRDIFAPVMVKIKDNRNIALHTGAGIAGVAVGAKIASVIAAKAAAKAGTKAAVKTGAKAAAKTGTKAAAASTAAATGVLCGPFVWLCAPALGIGAWVATDAIVVAGDEYLTRDDFRSELISSLDTMEYELKKSLKNDYKEQFAKASEEIRGAYKDTVVYERRKRIDDLFEQ